MVEFSNAFNSVDQDALLKVYKTNVYELNILFSRANCIEGSCAYDQTDAASRIFCLQEGLKQHGPSNALLFNAIVKACVRECENNYNRPSKR